MSTTRTSAEPAATPRRAFAERVRAFLDPRPARWRTVIVFGIVMAYADGYILVALTGAVGAIQRTEHLFGAWLEESAVLVPLFVLAELLVLRLVRRRTGPVLRSGKAVVVTALVIALGGTVAGVLAVTASAAYDYNLQTQLIDFSAQFSDQNGDPLVKAGATVARGNCNSMICNEERFSLATDIRGVGVGTPILLGINVVLVGWILTLFGGRLGAPARRPAAAPVGSDGNEQT
ncbi:MAG TPA: hypothetical protein VHV49_03120 [Pseudonocardiaceae bacterium]|jgi:hypothetical protein|nr:hypothetical protein [Pseudonocardiaceae bacterium]